MKAGITLTLHVAGFPAKVSGVFTEEDGIILDGSIWPSEAGDFRDALELLLEKCGCRVNLSFLPRVQADAVWMTYRQRQTEMGFGVKLADGSGELGVIQAVLGKSGDGKGADMLPKESSALAFRFAYLKTLSLSEIPVAGDWMGKGSLGPVEFFMRPGGGTELCLSYAYGDAAGKVRFAFPAGTKIKDEKRYLTVFGDEKDAVAVRWKPLKKSFGCVTLLAVGGAFSEGCLYVMLQAQLHLSILTVSLEGLGVRIPFGNLGDTRPVLTGLGLGVQTDGIRISGLFSKELNRPAYSGQLTIQVRTVGFSLMGAYEQTSFVSVFAVGILNLRLAGTGCVKIQKVAAGFGYNRRLFVPQIDKVGEFALMKVMRGGDNSGAGGGGDAGKPGAALDCGGHRV